jgi:hypothetical protein
MQTYLKVFVFLVICLLFLAPFAYDAPDGLERVAENLGIEDAEPLWRGLMPDYNFSPLENSYFSKVFAGAFGAFIVFSVAFLLGIKILRTKGEQKFEHL